MSDATKDTPIDPPADNARRLKQVAIVLLMVEASALTLKAWEEKRADDVAMISTMQREALAVSERIAGEAHAVEAAVIAGGVSRSALSRIEESQPNVDRIVRLDSARPDDPRGAAAAAMADTLLAEDRMIGLSAEGDMVVAVDTAGAPGVAAFGPAEAWLPTPAGERRFVLRGAPGRGDETLAVYDAALPQSSTILTGPGALRSAIGCVSVARSGLDACSITPAPFFSSQTVARLTVYGLLFAAPALAVFGLFGALAQRRAESAAANRDRSEATHHFDLVLDGAEAGSWQWREGDGGAQVSDRFATLLGLEGGGLLTRAQLTSLVFAEDRARLSEALDAGFETGAFDALFRTAQSEGAVWIEIKGRQVADEDEAGSPQYAGLAFDVTRRRAQELRLKEAERRLRAAVEAFSGPVALWDQRGRLVYWNAAFQDVFKLEDRLRAGLSRNSVVAARAAAIQSERVSDIGDDAEIVQLLDGRWLHLVDRQTPDGGRITLGVDVTENLSARQQLERQEGLLKKAVRELERSQGQAKELAMRYEQEKIRAEDAARAKSAFLANMSHELRTPLNAINGFSEIIVSELYGPLGDKRYLEYAGDIHAAGGHLLDLINDILDMSKIEAGKMSIDPKPVDPSDPVDAAVRIVRRKAEEKGVELALESDEDLPRIDADHRALRQMVLNLVGNAIKFTDEGGRIEVRLRRTGDHVVLEVADSGVGIPEEDLPRLAQPFEQVDSHADRNPGGTGLGLALTKSFAEMHGGRLDIASTAGEGTTVSIYLPIPTVERHVA